MKKKVFITAIIVIIMLFPCSVSATGFDTKDITIYAAGTYDEDIAPILFEWNELLYKGFINKQGELLFYVEWNYENDYDQESWKAFDWDFEELNSTTFEGGYSWFEKGDKRYIINTEGEIVSSYNRQDVLCTGAGYTWIVTENETAWDNPGGYSFILYKPNGKVETSLDFDFNNYEDWEVDELREELEDYEFHYFGQGVFGTKYNDKLYFTNSQKWVDYDDADTFWESKIKFDGNKYAVLKFDDDENGTYVTFIDKDGVLQRIDIAEIDIYYYRLQGISENYMLFSSDDVFYYFNIQEKSLHRYNGKFKDYVYTYMTYIHGEINNNYLAFTMSGADQKEYVALINCDTLEEYGPIYIKDRDSFSLKQDILVIENDTETQLLDLQGNILSLYDNEKDVRYVRNGVVVCMTGDDGWPEYYHYDGTKMFEKYDFSKATDLGLLIN